MVLSRYGNHNDNYFNIYKHGRVSKSYKVRISYSVRGRHFHNSSLHLGGNWAQHKDRVAVPFSFSIYIISQKTSRYISPTQTRDIVWCPGLTQPRHHNVTSVYLCVSNRYSQCTILSGGTHNICRMWVAFVLPSLNPLKV